MYDLITGEYIGTKKVKTTDLIEFKNKVDIFLKLNKIKGSATTYGFSTTDYKTAEVKLKSLNIKYRLDFTNNWNVSIIISKKQLI